MQIVCNTASSAGGSRVQTSVGGRVSSAQGTPGGRRSSATRPASLVHSGQNSTTNASVQNMRYAVSAFGRSASTRASGHKSSLKQMMGTAGTGFGGGGGTYFTQSAAGRP